MGVASARVWYGRIECFSRRKYALVEVGCSHLNHCRASYQFALHSITVNTLTNFLGQL